ncbi:MAG: AAA family ATPase [Gammaproteobacteria bacterium]|nr:AAA family ATPase [Gammaproteobacteria bacterium]
MNSTPTLTRNQLAALSLKQQPFQAPQRLAEIFLSPALNMLVNALSLQLIAHSHTQVVKGEAGSGKTTLASLLIYKQPQNASIYKIQATRSASVNDCLQQIYPNLSSHDLKTVSTKVATLLFRELRNRIQPVIIIDDAHVLSKKTLRSLLKYAETIGKQGSGQPRFVLIGERSIDQLLEQVEPELLDPSQVHSSLLRPFNRMEVEAYIQHRFAAAGCTALPFDNDSLERILNQAGGSPGNVNYLCWRELNKEAPSALLTWLRNHKTLLIVPGLVITLLFACLIVWSFRTYLLPYNVAAQRGNDAPVEIKNSITQQPNTPTKPVTAAPALIAATPSTINTTTNNNVINNNATQNAAPLYAHQWLRDQAPNHYMIQLLGTWDYPKLQALNNSLKLPRSLAYYRTERNDQTWHVLVYGPFDDYEQAQQALQQLPPELKASQPWIRKIDSILSSLDTK